MPTTSPWEHRREREAGWRAGIKSERKLVGVVTVFSVAFECSICGRDAGVGVLMIQALLVVLLVRVVVRLTRIVDSWRTITILKSTKIFHDACQQPTVEAICISNPLMANV